MTFIFISYVIYSIWLRQHLVNNAILRTRLGTKLEYYLQSQTKSDFTKELGEYFWVYEEGEDNPSMTDYVNNTDYVLLNKEKAIKQKQKHPTIVLKNFYNEPLVLS